MNCMEARRMVTPFIKRELTDRESEQFLKHIEHCDDCMDELDIYFTVYRALDSLDSGVHHENDFRKLMEEEIRSVKRGILRRKVFRFLRGFTLILAELLLLLSVYTGFEVHKGEAQQSTFHRAIHRLHSGDGSQLRAPQTEEKLSGTESGAAEEIPETEAGADKKTGEANMSETTSPEVQQKADGKK